eukprot:3404531-Pleurochrysis_carterae.AAC.7
MPLRMSMSSRQAAPSPAEEPLASSATIAARPAAAAVAAGFMAATSSLGEATHPPYPYHPLRCEWAGLEVPRDREIQRKVHRVPEDRDVADPSGVPVSRARRNAQLSSPPAIPPEGSAGREAPSSSESRMGREAWGRTAKNAHSTSPRNPMVLHLSGMLW